MRGQSGFEKEHVERARSGDERALSRLLANLEPILRAYFIKRIGMKADVDDLVQNTLVRMHNSLADLKDPDRLKAFAMKAALFELQDLYRGRYSAKERLYDPDTLPESALPDTTAGAHVDVERALAVLTPRARRIIELREFGYRYEEIAEMIGSTEAAIKMQVKRAFEKMRQALVSLIAGGLLQALLWH